MNSETTLRDALDAITNAFVDIKGAANLTFGLAEMCEGGTVIDSEPLYTLARLLYRVADDLEKVKE